MTEIDMDPKILVFSSSLRPNSFNTRLAELAVKEITLTGGQVTHISLADYELPIYDGELEANKGIPAAAIELGKCFSAHQGIFIATPEYNASVPPLLKNTLDWVSRLQEGPPPFKGRVFALGAASPGGFGGVRGLIALRQVLELGLGALVLPEQVIVSNASQAFNEGGELNDERTAGLLQALARRLVNTASYRVL